MVVPLVQLAVVAACLLVTALAVDPAVPSRLYALMEARLWRSTDAGASWQPAPTRGLSRLAAGMVRQVAVAR